MIAEPMSSLRSHDVFANMHGALFDLDGVIVDTAKYHYLAWRRLANELGFDFSKEHNERLKGVSRRESLRIMLEIGNVTASEASQAVMADRKNEWYVEYVGSMGPSEILPGAREYLTVLRGEGVKIALGSASKNARLILDNLGLTNLFDVIVDGTSVSKAKPDPEVFLRGAMDIGVARTCCVVFEDAEAGIEAALRAGMRSVGIGDPSVLTNANLVVSGLGDLLDRK